MHGVSVWNFITYNIEAVKISSTSIWRHCLLNNPHREKQPISHVTLLARVGVVSAVKRKKRGQAVRAVGRRWDGWDCCRATRPSCRWDVDVLSQVWPQTQFHSVWLRFGKKNTIELVCMYVESGVQIMIMYKRMYLWPLSSGMNFFHFQQLPAVRSGIRTPLRTTDSNLDGALAIVRGGLMPFLDPP